MHTPELGIFHAVTDAHGNIMVPEDRLGAAIVSSSGDPERLLESLALALGSAWDAELEPFRYAGDGAPVVRVLTVFDDLSSAYYGGDGNAVAELTATIDEVNAAYARSGVNLVMQSAAIERVGYASSQAAGADHRVPR